MLGDILTAVQDDILGYLRLGDGLEDVPMIPSRSPRSGETGGMINDLVEDALTGIKAYRGKAGLALIVMMPDVAPEDPDTPGPQMSLQVEVRVIENRIINEGEMGTGISAPQAAVQVARLLHHWSPDGVSAMRPARSLISDISTPDRAMHSVAFEVRMPVPSIPRASTPVLSGEPGDYGLVITLAAQSGAAIRYSLDGSFPTVSYTTPFVLDDEDMPVKIRAIALLQGHCASAVVEADVTA